MTIDKAPRSKGVASSHMKLDRKFYSVSEVMRIAADAIAPMPLT